MADDIKAIGDLTPIDYQWYVPSWNGNREIHKAHPDRAIKVQIKTPSYGSRRRMVIAQQARSGPDLAAEVAKLSLRVQEADLDDPQILAEVRRLLREVIQRHNPTSFDDEIDGMFFAEHVGEVTGVTLAKVPLVTGKALWDARERLPNDLMNELMRTINSLTALEAGLVDRLPVPSGSPASQAGNDGTVATVAAEA